MRYFLYLCIASLVMCSQVTCSEKIEGRLHALILFDSNPSILKGNHKTDAKALSDVLKRISSLIKTKLRLKIAKKHELSLNDIQTWFKKVQPAKDIVFVFYSGREDENGSYAGIWPSIALGTQPHRLPVPADMLCSLIQENKPRLQFIFLDFYDKSFKASKHDGVKFSNPFNKKKLSANFISRYWPKTTGTLLACSHAKGTLGFGIINGKKRIGSFSQCVLQALARISATGYSDFLEKHPFGCFIPDGQKFLVADSLKCPLPTSGIRDR